ncbi:MAG: UbiH/UbiF/VisC/COQ6 family ubiquinone biosynthesis hydroxylase [Pseudomonadota bacterium]
MADRADTKPNTHFDVSIVGGGLAGATLALALARQGFSIALVDALDPAVLRSAAFDGRTTALAFATIRMFRRLGVWDDISPDAEPIRDILITDGGLKSPSRRGGVADSFMHFDGDDLGGDGVLGWIVENRVIRNSVFDALEKTPNATIFAPIKVDETLFDKGSVRLKLSDHTELTSSLAIAADGKKSSLAAAAGLRSFSWTYRQKGIVFALGHEKPHRGVAQEYFLPGGPFAILPMTERRSSIVWTDRDDVAAGLEALGDSAFLEAAKLRFGDYLGEVHLASRRWMYPLGLHFSERFVAPRLALVGDAARAIHPIAGQGFNLGLKDVAAIVDVLTGARKIGRDIGDLSVLQEYDRWRRFDSTVLTLSTDFLNRFFSTDLAPLRAARRLGLSAINAMPPLKKTFMKESGADLGRLPELLQP